MKNVKIKGLIIVIFNALSWISCFFFIILGWYCIDNCLFQKSPAILVSMFSRPITKRLFPSLAGSSILVFLISSLCAAQDDYPSQPINVVTHTSPGGGTDTTARSVVAGTKLALDIDMAVVPKPGAAGVVADQQPLHGRLRRGVCGPAAKGAGWRPARATTARLAAGVRAPGR